MTNPSSIQFKKVGRYLAHPRGHIMLTITTDGDGYGHVACRECDQGFFINAPSYMWLEWIEGKRPIQNVFPNMPSEQRELLISGICSECFKNLFPDD